MPLSLALASELCTARIFSPNLGCTESWGELGAAGQRQHQTPGRIPALHFPFGTERLPNHFDAQ